MINHAVSFNTPIIHVAVAVADTDETYGAYAAAENDTFNDIINSNNTANNNANDNAENDANDNARNYAKKRSAKNLRAAAVAPDYLAWCGLHYACIVTRWHCCVVEIIHFPHACQKP